MSGETNLTRLIRNMQPVLQDGEYVFASVKNIDEILRSDTICEFEEAEGTTVVLSKVNADKYSLSYDFVAAWITLKVHSALEAVGLTAAFATVLGEHNISCNVIAGYYHDHIFVGLLDKEKAIHVLQNLSKNYKG